MLRVLTKMVTYRSICMLHGISLLRPYYLVESSTGIRAYLYRIAGLAHDTVGLCLFQTTENLISVVYLAIIACSWRGEVDVVGLCGFWILYWAWRRRDGYCTLSFCSLSSRTFVSADHGHFSCTSICAPVRRPAVLLRTSLSCFFVIETRMCIS